MQGWRRRDRRLLAGMGASLSEPMGVASVPLSLRLFLPSTAAMGMSNSLDTSWGETLSG